MNGYQVTQTTANGDFVLHHSLTGENAMLLARLYALKHSKNEEVATYSASPMYDIDQHDVDFSNDIVKDMLKESVAETVFLDEFLKRKAQIKQALNKMTQEAKEGKRIEGSLDDYLNSLD